jgi:FtsZ-interacting cell division protein ZipA
MATWVWIVIAIAVVLVVLLAAWTIVSRRRRTGQLRDRFGPEYDRTIEDADSKRKAERELRDRQERRDELDIRPLTPAARDRYSEQWQATQARFVDDPGGAVKDADRLVQEVMRERGYPTDDFERRAADISVDYPHIVDNYRAAHGVAVAHERNEASTEDLRQSLVHYRSLFEELLVVEDHERAAAP